MKKMPFETDKLKKWFAENKRDLPWRRLRSPYAVWISEVMLQQTQASVVVDYFHRWMERFPTIASLAEAPLDTVLKVWEGLGYYSRARYVHAAACHFLEKHGGEIPADRQELQKVKGLGPYTTGAILSFAFHKKAAAVDANVARVLSRYFCLEEDLVKLQKRLWEIAEEILPEQEPWVVVEGLIELGAMVCGKDPKCAFCPIRKGCVAFHQGKQKSLPIKKKNKEITLLSRYVAVIYCDGHFLLKRGNKGKVMADLYEFPYFEGQEEITAAFPFAVFEKELQEQSHSFTRYRARLFPTLWRAMEKKEHPHYSWVEEKFMRTLPFSSGHRRILQDLEMHENTTH